MKSDQADALCMISAKYFFLNSAAPFEKKKKQKMRCKKPNSENSFTVYFDSMEKSHGMYGEGKPFL